MYSMSVTVVVCAVLGKARQSIAWVNEQSPSVKRENAEQEQAVIDFLNKNETPELREQRLQSLAGDVAVGVIGLSLVRK